jgi:membrane protein YqaA with SNARE-associated domain
VNENGGTVVRRAMRAGGRPGPVEASVPRWWLRRLYDWVISWSESRWGTVALALVAFTESSFFPVPPDPLQIALSFGQPRRAFWYACVATVFSVLGGVFGWWLGWVAWEGLDEFFFTYVPGFTEEDFRFIQQSYAANAFWAILAGAFTPIPYKVFTVASGVFEIPLMTLVVASILGRGGRFFGVALCVYLFGPAVRTFLERYFETFTLIFFVLLVGFFLLLQYLF